MTELYARELSRAAEKSIGKRLQKQGLIVVERLLEKDTPPDAKQTALSRVSTGV